MKFSELDDTDRKILRILQEDSTLTVKELAMRVNLSASPTFDRQKRLEREGFIQGYHAIVDAKKTDNGITVLCNMRLKRHSQMLMDDFMQAIQSIDEITECYKHERRIRLHAEDSDARHGHVSGVHAHKARKHRQRGLLPQRVRYEGGEKHARRSDQVSEKPAHLFCSLSNLHYLCKRKD